ncbi:MAG: hypothetical protein AAFO94_18375 [Bacteroidota bacterium]
MKSFKFLAFFLIGLLAMVACDKEATNELDTAVAEQIEKPEPAQLPTGEAIDISDRMSHIPEGAEGRGANILLFSDTATVGQGGWKLYRYNRSALLPGFKYNAIITPLTSGDPDLYIYGFDAEDASPWRHVRNSRTTSIDMSHLWPRELTVQEEAGYFAVYGYTGATFKIEILRENVCGTEDCIPFNTHKLRYVQEGSQYLITDGYSRMLMAPNVTEARKIVNVLQYYGLNRSCFVGRPGASFFYYTKNGQSPVGAMPGEDCVSFDPNTAEVKQINGTWKIVDGSHWMFDFGRSKEEAEQTLCLIKKYGFTKSCFVGRPGPSLQYMRK